MAGFINLLSACISACAVWSAFRNDVLSQRARYGLVVLNASFGFLNLAFFIRR